MSSSDDTFRLLYEVAVATSGVLEPERLAQLAVERARQLTGADGTLLFWWVPERDLLALMACDPPGSTPRGCTRRRGQGAVGLAFEMGSPQVIEDYGTWPQALPSTTERGVGAAMALPLFVGGRAEGVLCVRRYESTRWSERQLETLSLLASLVAPAMTAARMHADLESSQESFRAVYADAQDQLMALVREFGLHRTDATGGGEPVSMSEHQALIELSSGEELSQMALAVRLRLEKSTISRLAVQMESRGWLERNRDTADARLVRLRLTPRGRALARDLSAFRASKLQGMLRTIPESDRESVLQSLKIVIHALNRSAERDADEASGTG